MEAIWRIEVVDFPAFIVIDDKGNDFFADHARARPPPCQPARVDGVDATPSNFIAYVTEQLPALGAGLGTAPIRRARRLSGAVCSPSSRATRSISAPTT